MEKKRSVVECFETVAGVPGVLDLCLMPTPQVVTMKPKSCVPQVARFVSKVLMLDIAQWPPR